MLSPHLLSLLLFLPLLGAVFIFLRPEGEARPVAVVTSAVMVVFSAILTFNFNTLSAGQMQFSDRVSWFTMPFPVEYVVGVDGMGLCLVVLTSVVTLLSVLASEKIG